MTSNTCSPWVLILTISVIDNHLTEAEEQDIRDDYYE